MIKTNVVKQTQSAVFIKYETLIQQRNLKRQIPVRTDVVLPAHTALLCCPHVSAHVTRNKAPLFFCFFIFSDFTIALDRGVHWRKVTNEHEESEFPREFKIRGRALKLSTL